MPSLREARVPATFFLCGASLTTPKSAWWERLQRAVERGHTPANLADLLPEAPDTSSGGPIDLHLLGQAVEALSPDQRRRLSERLLEYAGPDPGDAGLAQEAVAELAAAGFEIGFHTRDHDTLTALNDDELKRRMEEGRKALSEAAGSPLQAIAYPHGRGDIRVADAARQAGFEIGYTGTRVAVTPSTDRLLLGRCDAASLGPSLGEFAIGVAGTLLLNSREG